MPIVVKNPNKTNQLDEFVMLELQGDIECREDELSDLTGQFVGDLLYNKFAQPVSERIAGCDGIYRDLINFLLFLDSHHRPSHPQRQREVAR